MKSQTVKTISSTSKTKQRETHQQENNSKDELKPFKGKIILKPQIQTKQHLQRTSNTCITKPADRSLNITKAKQ